MNRVNYAANARLLEEEVFDLDVSEDWETGINAGRMRLPTRYDISKFYQRFKTPSHYDREGNPLYERGRWMKRKEELVNFGGDDFSWQITYKFPDTLRDNVTSAGKKYGGNTVTYRRLYLILCEHFNDGEFFVDEYFNSVYPDTLKPEVDARLDDIKSDLIASAEEELSDAVVTKEGTFDKRYKVNRGMSERLNAWESFAADWEDTEGEEIAALIKEDIIDSLMTGRIPLNHINADSTKIKRYRAGLSDEPEFFAMGELIEHIQLFVKIRGKGWKTSQGISV